MTKTFFELKEELNLNENDNETIHTKHPNRYDPDGPSHFQNRHPRKAMMTKLQKGMTPHEKKHMKGAYSDGSSIVHRSSDRTMSNTMSHSGGAPKSKTYGAVRKEIQAHIAKHHPEK